MKPLSPSPYVEPLDAATLDRLKALYKQLIDAENRRLNKLLQNLGGGIFYWEAPPTCPTVIETASANTPIVGATDTFPIQITTATAHDYSTGQVVLIKDVLGNTAANGTWIITVTSGTSFNLNGSAGNGPYIHGGGTAFTTKITTAPHGLVSLQLAMIAGVNGTTSANGTWRCTVLSSTTFSIASEWNAAWTSGGTVGDGGTAIPSSASNGRWRRIYSGALNVRWFGAIGIVNLVTGVIFDGTEVSTIRDCYFECMNGVWVTGGNQRLNNPLTDPNNEYGQSNVIFVDNSWFGCSQISYAAEGNATQRLNGCNFENGLWYGWTSGVELLRVADMQSEAGASGWYIGTLAPFNGNQSGANYGVLFDNCLISPAAQSSTNVATAHGPSRLSTLRISFCRGPPTRRDTPEVERSWR